MSKLKTDDPIQSGREFQTNRPAIAPLATYVKQVSMIWRQDIG